MLNEQLMNEMMERAKHSPLFQNWITQVIAGIDDDEVMNITMLLCCSLDDVANAYKDKLLKTLQDIQYVMSAEKIELEFLPTKPTGVAESSPYVFDSNLALVAMEPPTQHPNNLPPFPTEEDERGPDSTVETEIAEGHEPWDWPTNGVSQ